MKSVDFGVKCLSDTQCLSEVSVAVVRRIQSEYLLRDNGVNHDQQGLDISTWHPEGRREDLAVDMSGSARWKVGYEK